MRVLRTDNAKHNIPYIGGFSMPWRVTWATEYVTRVILAPNFRSRINCTLLLKKSYSSFNLTNYLKIVENAHSIIAKGFFSYSHFAFEISTEDWILVLSCTIFTICMILAECRASSKIPIVRRGGIPFFWSNKC